jgi:hypothetical protein
VPAGEQAVDDMRAFIARFVYAADHELDLLTLWYLHTHVYEAFSKTPRLAALSEQAGEGKTTILNLGEVFCRTPITAGNVSEAVLYRLMEAFTPTLLMDETDAIWPTDPRTGKVRSGGKANTLRQIFDSGYMSNGKVWRVIRNEPTVFHVYVPVAFAGIGSLPDTLLDRSIVIHMRKPSGRKLARLEEWEPEIHGAEAEPVAAAAIAFITEVGPELNLRPPMPKGVELRQKQIWTPIISLAQAISPAWLRRAQNACRVMALDEHLGEDVQPGEELIRALMDDERVAALIEEADPKAPVWLTTGELIDILRDIRADGTALGWAMWLNNRITAQKSLAALVRPYGIQSGTFRREGMTRRGYKLRDFAVWLEGWVAKQQAEERKASAAQASRAGKRTGGRR